MLKYQDKRGMLPRRERKGKIAIEKFSLFVMPAQGMVVAVKIHRTFACTFHGGGCCAG